MVAFVQQNCIPILVVGTILAIILFAICVIKKLVRLAVGIAVLSVVISILFTIFWGDGSSYISEIASYLSPSHQQQLEDAYAYYKSQDAENPVIDYDAVSNKVTDVFASMQNVEKEIAQETTDSVKEKADEWLKQSSFPKDKDADPEP